MQIRCQYCNNNNAEVFSQNIYTIMINFSKVVSSGMNDWRQAVGQAGKIIWWNDLNLLASVDVTNDFHL